MPEGGVGVGGGEGAAGGVEFADVLSEVPTVCIPCAVDLDGQRTGGDRLCGVPCDIPQSGVVAAGEVNAGNLQIASIDVALVERDAAVDAHLLVRAASHRIVGAFHHGAGVGIREDYGTVLGIVHSAPGAGLGLDKRLVSIGIELRDERRGAVLRDSRVLVERVRLVHRCLVILQRKLSVADVIIGVLIVCAVDGRSFQF